MLSLIKKDKNSVDVYKPNKKKLYIKGSEKID
jgi:hypothetical protein